MGVGVAHRLGDHRSACCGVSVALALLLPGFGSNWSVSVMVAVLVRASGLTTVAGCSASAGAGGDRADVQTPVALL